VNTNVGVYALSVAVLFVAVLLATMFPVRRATKVDPLFVLRIE
jgi:ABC-type lipoprotein release transport system permease subunit